MADIAFGHPAQKAKWMMASLSWVSGSPLVLARTRVSAESVGAAPGDQAGDRDEAAVASGEFVAFSDVAEENVSGEVDELGGEVAHELMREVHVLRQSGGPRGIPSTTTGRVSSFDGGRRRPCLLWHAVA